MKRRIISLLVAALVVGCSTTTTAANYHEQMNQPTVQAGMTKDKDEAKLNPRSWKEIEITQNSSDQWVDEDGDTVLDHKQGYLFMRASVVNENTRPIEVKWRCKFYNSTNHPIAEEEYNKTATTTTGLGWHREIIYPVTASHHTDDANVLKCVSPSKRAVTGKFEVHDLADDIVVYR